MSRKRAELTVAALLAAVAVAAVGFIVAYVAGADTQALGITAGVAFMALAAAAIITGGSIVDATPATEERPEYTYRERPDPEADDLRADLASGADGISRRRLLGSTAGAAGLALGGALIVPLASLGPDTEGALTDSPWAEGKRLVDENDVPVRADVLEMGSFLTAFPEGAEKNTYSSPVVVVRTDPAELDLPPEPERTGCVLE